MRAASPSRRLSDPMREALCEARVHGGRLIVRTSHLGRFWTYEGCPGDAAFDGAIPVWEVTEATVRALVARHLVHPVNDLRSATAVTLTDQGIAVARDLMSAPAPVGEEAEAAALCAYRRERQWRVRGLSQLGRTALRIAAARDDRRVSELDDRGDGSPIGRPTLQSLAYRELINPELVVRRPQDAPRESEVSDGSPLGDLAALGAELVNAVRDALAEPELVGTLTPTGLRAAALWWRSSSGDR
jgi:hypothetical protein